jgi:hypothetical protein
MQELSPRVVKRYPQVQEVIRKDAIRNVRGSPAPFKGCPEHRILFYGSSKTVTFR